MSKVNYYLLILCMSLVLWACNNREKKGPAAVLHQPGNLSAYPVGKAIPVRLEVQEEGLTIDSIQCSLDGKKVALTPSATTGTYTFQAKGHALGEHILNIQVYYDDHAPDTYQGRIILLSDTPPATLSYQVVQQYPHDTTDFTQGLYYNEGIMFEGTGLRGNSKLKKYRLQTGKLLKEVKLPQDIFGEGITVFDDLVYQLSYQEKQVFKYDKETLQQVGSFHWQLEGWGLTQDSTHLIVSTGSQYLFFVDTSRFQVVRRIQVADHQKLLDNLNELEYVNGKIWANIWETDEIIAIDPQSGKVLASLSLKGILPGYEAENQEEKVLNGIAYNPTTQSYYVTGKKWPALFEIKIEPEEAALSALERKQ